MELTISIAHFCDNHGPTSILCTQPLPVYCFSCQSQSTASSFSDLNTASSEHISKENTLPSKTLGSFDFGDVHDSTHDDETSKTQFPNSTNLHRHTNSDDTEKTVAFPERRTARPVSSSGGGAECINCSIKIPASISSRLPAGSPGSPQSSFSGSSASSPTLRSKLPVRIYDDPESGYCSDSDSENPPSHHRHSYQQQYLSPESFNSTATTSTSSFHEHTQTYFTTHAPLDPSTYSSLRHSIIRTLSGEQLPRGLAGGRLFFGTPADGHTIAYTFRLPDKYARGGHRLYSLVALAGHDTRKAYRAISTIWRHFQYISEWIADKVAEEARTQTEGSISEDPEIISSQGPPLVSSFLTGRNNGGGHGVVGGDVFGRRGGGVGGGLLRGRGLVEMTGDEQLFAKLHMRFVELLREFSGR